MNNLEQLAAGADSIAKDLHNLSGRNKRVKVTESNGTAAGKLIAALAGALPPRTKKRFFSHKEVNVPYKLSNSKFYADWKWEIKGCLEMSLTQPNVEIKVYKKDLMDHVVAFASRQRDDLNYEVMDCSG